jgi:penicillin-binding protein 2
VEEPYRLTPQTALRVAILGFLALSVFAVLFLRLWALQVLSGDKYLRQANNNRVRTLPSPAPRGFILDRNGRVLVKNAQGSSFELWPADLPKNNAAQLEELGRLATLTGVRVKEIQRRMKAFAGDPLTPVVIRRGVHDDQILYFYEHRLDWVFVSEQLSALLPLPVARRHLLGYVGEITQTQLRQRHLGYRLGDVIGQAGVESTYDRYLRERGRSAQVTVDCAAATSPNTPQKTPRAGYTVRLTLDIGIQRAAERALRYGIRLAHNDGQWAADGGAIVALDPHDGSVLAMASYPTYKPSVYVSRDPTKLAPPPSETLPRARTTLGSTVRSMWGIRPGRPGSR